MDDQQFVKAAGQIVNLVADYHANLPKKRKVIVRKEEGFLTAKKEKGGEGLPIEPPQEAEKWEDIFGDIDRVVLKNVITIPNWQPASYQSKSFRGEMAVQYEG